MIGQLSRQKLAECFPLILHTSKVDSLFNFSLKCQVQQNITIPISSLFIYLRSFNVEH